MWNSNHRPEHVKPDLEATLKDLGVRLLNDDGMYGTQRMMQINISSTFSYIDSFVIHWPQAVPSTGKRCALRPDGCYPDNHSKGIYYLG